MSKVKTQCLISEIKALKRSNVNNKELQVNKLPLYEYRDFWAEEGGAANANSAEWSYGNGAVGFMGLPIDAGWEVIVMAYHADTFAATATIEVDLMDYTTPSNAAANTIGFGTPDLARITVNGSTDGDGGTNNAYKWFELPNPVPIIIPAGKLSIPLGVITRTTTGNKSDQRVYARLRRQIGEYVSDVQLINI